MTPSTPATAASRLSIDVDATAAFTIGYEGRNIGGLVRTLRRHGVEQLVDVREIPLSRKPGFSKNALEAALARAGIAYFLIRELGSPRKIRAAYRASGDFSRFKEKYEHHLETVGPAVDELDDLLRQAPTAILCFERDASACHRSIVCEALADRYFSFTHV